MRQLLTAAQVAQLLGHSLGWFHRKRAELEERSFPRPIDGCGMRWDPRAIEAWLDARLPAAASPEAAMEAELLRRARAMSAPMMAAE